MAAHAKEQVDAARANGLIPLTKRFVKNCDTLARTRGPKRYASETRVMFIFLSFVMSYDYKSRIAA
jgi:hypothetical protein